MTKLYLLIIPILLLAAILVVLPGCGEKDDQSPTRGSSFLAEDLQDTSAVIVGSISRTLNHMPDEVVTELTPPQPILDDSTSADGREVQAILGRTPGVPDSPFNYLSVPEGNANFRTLDVQRGDIVRFFVKYNQEDLEHGYENVSYYELIVRRRDINNQQNALILEGGLTAPVDFPHRIEVWRASDRRMRDITSRLNRYLFKPKDMIGWEPSPDESALLQMVDRLNQWWRNLTNPMKGWQLDPMIEQLPESLRSQEPISSLLTPEALTNGGFQQWEMRLLQQAIWLRDISSWAKGDALSDVEVAAMLFDWTVRNIQLDRPGADTIIHHPWQALMYGHGSAEDRAWVFAELCRHQQLDVVMLATLTDEGEPQWWLSALLSEGQLHLFDSRLGLPIPSSDQESVATLAEVMEKPELLDSLSVDGAEPYPLNASMFRDSQTTRISAWTVATHLQLARRTAELQRLFSTEEFVTLAADDARVAADLQELEQLGDVSLWPFPFQSLVDEQNMSEDERKRAVPRFLIFAQRPKLWKARVLHFQGDKDIPLSERNDPLAQADFGHRKATELYQDRTVRISERILRSLDRTKQAIYRVAKMDAGYWLALLKSAQGNHSVARHWLETQTLGSAPKGPWRNGARYNLARTYEELGELEKAIELLEADESPQRLGNLLRARRLREKLTGSTDAESENQAQEQADQLQTSETTD